MTSPTKNRIDSNRRNFLFGTLGASALAVGFYSRWTRRMVKGLIQESRRDVAIPLHSPTPHQWNSQHLTAAWLGHSTVLINFLGFHILTDPVLFNRIGADVGLGTVGPKRYIAPALASHQLPSIDLVLLSHAHMDHLDYPSLRSLPRTNVVTAKSTADLLQPTALKPIHELAWGEKVTIRSPHGIAEIEAFPVKHWGARWRRDTFRGYNGYIISRAGRKIIFGGDTAYCPHFADLKSKGPFELALMPIGAYQPWIHSHCNPEQAVTMADQAGARFILPIHHQTFNLGEEGPSAPLERLERFLRHEDGRIALRHIGETFTIDV